jgi:biotin carboxyl carrier protein
LRIAAGDTKRMQNELKTNTTGTVTIVHIQEGATVETGTILITVVAPEA